MLHRRMMCLKYHPDRMWKIRPRVVIDFEDDTIQNLLDVIDFMMICNYNTFGNYVRLQSTYTELFLQVWIPFWTLILSPLL
jgi:methyl coenzyme M reductase subunit D